MVLPGSVFRSGSAMCIMTCTPALLLLCAAVDSAEGAPAKKTNVILFVIDGEHTHRHCCLYYKFALCAALKFHLTDHQAALV